MQSPIVPTGDNRPAGAIVAQRDARSNGGDVAAVSVDGVVREAVGWVDRAGVRSARRRDRVVNLFVVRDEVPHVELIGECHAEP